MKWKNLILAVLVVLVLLGQHIRLRQAEARLDTLADCCQRQELKLKELSAPEEPDPVPEAALDLARKYLGYFDDHDVSGLLEED